MRIKNDSKFELQSLLKQNLEELIAVSETNSLKNVDILCFKTSANALWNRIFLDAGIGFWEEMSEDDIFNDFADYHKIDLIKVFNIPDTLVQKFTCTKNTLSQFNLRLRNIEFTFCFSDLSDLDSSTKLTYSIHKDSKA